MSVEFAYRFQQTPPRTGFKDLDDVVLTAAVVADDGATVSVGTEGTIVSVSPDDLYFVVEFAEPAGTLATVEAHEIRLSEPAPL